MRGKIIKKLLLVSGLIIFLIGISYVYHMYYALLLVLGVILITLGWKYPKKE